MGKGWKTGDVPESKISNTGGPPRHADTSAGIITPPAEQTSSSGRKNEGKKEQQRPARLRSLCQVATYPGFEGKRMVLTGLTEEQVQVVQQAAAGAGVRLVE